MSTSTRTKTRRLIEDWLPIAELSEESARERRSMTALPPTYYLHVWFARRPLVASRAAILASFLGSDADRQKLLRDLGIHGDPVASRERIDRAKQTGVRFEGAAYTYSRAFTFTPPDLLRGKTLLDPTAGGGSIPFEAVRLGCNTIANDLNPVAALILKATVELPLHFGSALSERFKVLAAKFVRKRDQILEELIPKEPNANCAATNWLWTRTITCPYCEGIVPLSPNWKLDSSGRGVRLVPENRRFRFEIVERESDHSPGTVKGGDATCPFPHCGRTIDGDEIKSQAQAGKMGHQLYCVVYREERVVGHTKKGIPKTKAIRGFRAPRGEDDVDELVQKKLMDKMPLWQARNIIPDEEIDALSNYDRGHRLYGINKWIEMFSSRQLYCHCVSVEVFQEMWEQSDKSPVDLAALTYLAFSIDKLLNYNAISVRWIPQREVVASVFDRHNFAFYWSYAELAPTIAALGYDWAIEQTGKALEELVELLGQSASGRLNFDSVRPKPLLKIICRSGDALPIPDASVDCVVMDPPYYHNVMYAELSDFFYVWLKRTAGLLYPELFIDHLTDKDREAVANLARFKGQKGGSQHVAKRDYQKRMAAIFEEQRRVLKPDGIMTVMFTHKEADAWDALATGLIDGGFSITASWPVNTEAEGSLHIREKSAARSTIFLVCRVRETRCTTDDARYWEEVEPLVRQAVRAKVKEFQEAGIGGIDLYLACFGPALQVFTEAWPLTRGTARPQPRTKQKNLFEKFDPYAVRPEDALEAARREVKRWRMDQLATVKRQHHLDALTEWYVLAWDAFRAPRFPADEALKLARVVGLDFDQQVKNWVCEIKGEMVVLWDSVTRHRNGKLPSLNTECMLDAVHWAAKTAREQNTGAAKNMIQDARLLQDPTWLTALEAMLNVLPPIVPSAKKKPDAILSGAANDFQALERLRKLAFADSVPAPKIPEQLVIELPESDETDDDSAD
jgi:putative DNA methylase